MRRRLTRPWWWRVRPFACRIGLHFMAYDFPRDQYQCACRRQVLRAEDIWRAGR